MSDLQLSPGSALMRCCCTVSGGPPPTEQWLEGVSWSWPGVTIARLSVLIRAWKRSIRRFVITEKAPTRAFSWLKASTTAFTFKTLLRHYAKRALTPRSLNVKLGTRRNYHKGWAAIRHYANQPAGPLWPLCWRPIFTSTYRGINAILA